MNNKQKISKKNLSTYFRIRLVMFNATFNNISVISWRSVLLVDESRVPGDNHWPAASHWQTLLHNVVSKVPRLSGIQTHTFSGDWHWLHLSQSNQRLGFTDLFFCACFMVYMYTSWYPIHGLTVLNKRYRKQKG
jgi:hypothetical protein